MGRKVIPEKRFTESGVRLPDPLPDGEILTDTKFMQWKIGRSIGFGGFGEIYLASEYPTTSSRGGDNSSQYVVKVEPHSSSTLFVEMNFYLRVATEEKVNEWQENYQQNVLGMPHIVGFGSHYFHEKLRYLILPRYGCDVQKKFLELGRRFHPKTAFTLCYYIVDILEYIHSHGYVHNDIKASNLVLGLEGQAPVYLMDFGLACRYVDKNTEMHKPYCEDERRAHNGTIEYTSRDGHCGAVSRKSDLEILGYNLLQWLVGYLPWEMDLSDPDRVFTLKKRAMSHIKEFVARCYTKDSPPEALIDYLRYIESLKFDTVPDYKYIKKLFRQGVQQSGFKFDKILSFDTHHVPLSKVKSMKRVKSEVENMIKESPRKVFIIKNSIKTPELRIPCNVQDFNRITRHSATESQILSNKRFDWVKVLQSNPEEKFKVLHAKQKERLMSEKSCDNLTSCDELINTIKMSNPTYAMIEQMEKMRQRQIAEQNGTLEDETMLEDDDPNNNLKKNKKKRNRKLSSSSSTTGVIPLRTSRKTKSTSILRTKRVRQSVIANDTVLQRSNSGKIRKLCDNSLAKGVSKANDSCDTISPKLGRTNSKGTKNDILSMNGKEVFEKKIIKRSVGRPKKSDINISSNNYAVKKSPGRPRKSDSNIERIKNDIVNDVIKKKSPGSPEKIKKKPGRPKKSETFIAIKNNEINKTSPGRPRKSDSNIERIKDKFRALFGSNIFSLDSPRVEVGNSDLLLNGMRKRKHSSSKSGKDSQEPTSGYINKKLTKKLKRMSLEATGPSKSQRPLSSVRALRSDIRLTRNNTVKIV